MVKVCVGLRGEVVVWNVILLTRYFIEQSASIVIFCQMASHRALDVEGKGEYAIQ